MKERPGQDHDSTSGAPGRKAVPRSEEDAHDAREVIRAHLRRARTRLAALLHDGPAQELTALRLQFFLMQRRIKECCSDAAEKADLVSSGLDQVSSDISDLSRELRDSLHPSSELEYDIRRLCRRTLPDSEAHVCISSSVEENLLDKMQPVSITETIQVLLGELQDSGPAWLVIVVCSRSGILYVNCQYDVGRSEVEFQELFTFLREKHVRWCGPDVVGEVRQLQFWFGDKG